MAFKTPILLLIFTRLDTTIKVFERIKEKKPKYLFIASDGPRADKPEDVVKINVVQEYILSRIDWDCEIKTLFREQNLGCGLAVSGAITWFFEQVEEGIILEDDCLPHPDFFSFCEETLTRYKADKRIWEISGTNLQGGVKRGDGSYYFSNYGGIWGWATWARAWKHYDFDLKNNDTFIKDKHIQRVFQDKKQQRFWMNTLKNAKDIDTWDYQWLMTIWTNNGLSIIPNVNLIENIGFSAAGTHTKDEPKWYRALTKGNGKLGEMSHPDTITVNTEADNFFYYNCFKVPVFNALVSRVKSGIKRKLFKA
ncbi:nucleotide-diphospho-sugar transferase [Mucilaginibacter rubeus]|uniref:Nucleotide-diphospho-sugar transferase n=1 Tax=Mucilaginibacter rubeus TaxID=2027860 RepID=A0AAE6JE41_9SPHI|nr:MULTISPECIES: nucleotide-diphospho-sugar transferase [Mucilaginibacter]QEM03450.1 nucleotide-diphospho-sugar transferase [Mucilaginibacter rubeus]QEM16065.1 nucleotide-diphospho-sugar transferase [Mucilaginibacter gossypii]QTE41181.1 nucleotide-diphospho-sugar transferase [Mucilaginibacter rubeus]QTE47785.1 nucleotide-diphospho-sugar transferase [Mucilaginibacter rubeus]QTE59176.1 nucleotide-diphospho-sugar transferase [Mucilaginibacter rubeus]